MQIGYKIWFSQMEMTLTKSENYNLLRPGWKRVKFGDVVRLSKARSNDPIADGYDRYIGLEHIEPEDLRIRRWGNVVDGVTFTSVFKPGQVLFGKRRAYQRKVAVADFAGVCSGDIYVFESKDPQKLLPELLPFICQTEAFFQHAVDTSAGSLSPRTNWTSLNDFQFALPPSEEQHQITSLLTEIEEASNALEALSISSDRLCRALMISYFETNHIEWAAVSNIGTWYSGGTPSRGIPSYWGGSIPWVSPKEMKIKELDTTEEKLTKAGLETGLKLMPTDTIMIVVRGMILAHTFPVARTLVPAAFNQDMKALVVGEDFRPKYIQLWFEHAAPRYLQLVSESSHGTKRLESDKLFSLSVPKVSQKEQDQLIEKIEGIRNAAMKTDERRSKALEIKHLFLNEKLDLGS